MMRAIPALALARAEVNEETAFERCRIQIAQSTLRPGCQGRMARLFLWMHPGMHFWSIRIRTVVAQKLRPGECQRILTLGTIAARRFAAGKLCVEHKSSRIAAGYGALLPVA